MLSRRLINTFLRIRASENVIIAVAVLVLCHGLEADKAYFGENIGFFVSGVLGEARAFS